MSLKNPTRCVPEITPDVEDTVSVTGSWDEVRGTVKRLLAQGWKMDAAEEVEYHGLPESQFTVWLVKYRKI